MTNKIQDAKKIVDLFSTLQDQDNEVTLFFFWKEDHESAFNLVASIESIQDPMTIVFQIDDVQDQLLEDFFYQYDPSIQVVFLNNLNRYSFHMKIKDIRKQQSDAVLIVAEMPSIGDCRPIRRAIRLVNNLSSNLDPNEVYVYDISMSGLGLLVPQTLSVQLKDRFQCELNIPSSLETEDDKKFWEVVIRIVRIKPHSETFSLMGAEFLDVSDFNQAWIYRYILQRKNELLAHTNTMPPVEVISLTPLKEAT